MLLNSLENGKLYTSRDSVILSNQDVMDDCALNFPCNFETIGGCYDMID